MERWTPGETVARCPVTVRPEPSDRCFERVFEFYQHIPTAAGVRAAFVHNRCTRCESPSARAAEVSLQLLTTLRT